MVQEPGRDKLKVALESLLFVADDPVEIDVLARICGAKKAGVAAAVEELAAESQARGVRIQRTGQAVQMVSAPESAPYVEQYLGVDENARLSPSALVTLTVIAYRQPITKPELERILNKNCDYGVSILKARGLVTEVGRAPSAGRPYLYGTTFKFLEHFGLEKPEDLPPLPELEAAAEAAETEAPGEEDDRELPDALPEEPPPQ
jgi:segregation and condensation protein B